MSRKINMNQTLVIALSLALAAATLYFAFGNSSLSSELRPGVAQLASAFNADGLLSDKSSDARRDRLIEANRARQAPALAEGTWINSEPLKLEVLKGRVVIVDFWTFGCYNCRNTLPSLKKWDERYRERGLTIIGVHSPEFEREKKLENVRAEVRSLGIRYAVLTDNDYETWRAFDVEAWPTTVILDKQGRIRWTHVGEGMYDEMESVIQKLLAEKS
jgi:thiol-disulfide isomerase/thioredoxin